ncbi:hypothetical protein GCM10010191_60420 [Actinomadura vinacea]|uniref:MftR C-terminal domain-containing protein n=1 Tax=Actinomadura vinacea TaxID=115336 RepID=A0ABN3JTP0_9ACTN
MTPALRSRLWESQYATQQVIVSALADEDPFEVQVAAGACLAAATAAVTRSADGGGREDLRSLMAEALEVIIK